jgi:F0F1-type ATP synthase delta subunit
MIAKNLSKTVRLPADLYSPEQLGAVIMELRVYVGALRDRQVRAKVKHTEVAAPQASALLQSVMECAQTATTDKGAVEDLQHQLETIRDQAPTAHLMMAALPNHDLKRKLTDWFREQVHPYALLTFAARADIGGGVILQAGSHIYDYSFRKQIQANRHRISEIYNVQQ